MDRRTRPSLLRCLVGLAALSLAAWLSAQITLPLTPSQYLVVGNVSGVNGGTGGDLMQARLTLVNCGAATPTVTGVTLAIKGSKTFTASANGSFSGLVWGNDAISCNGVASTLYQVTYLRNNVPAGVPLYYRIVGPTDLTNATPVTVLPPTPALAAGLTCPKTSAGIPQAMVGVLSNFTPVCSPFQGSKGDSGPPGTTDGLISATVSQSAPGAANGIVRGFATCASGAPCVVNAESGYAPTDATVPTGNAQRLVNNTTGGNLQTFSNPAAASANQGFVFSGANCNQQLYAPNGNPSGGYNSYCDVINYISSQVGTNDGYSSQVPTASVGWTPSSAHATTFYGQGQGIHNLENYSVYCVADGDCNGINIDPFQCFGNLTDPSGEGCNPFRLRTGESPNAYYGTITQGGANARQLYLTPQGDGHQLGAGRFMWDFTGPGYYGFATSIAASSQDYGRLTILTDPNANYPVSTFQGYLLHDIAPQSQLSMPVTQPGTFAVCTYLPFAVTSGTLAAGDLIAFDSTYHEQTRVSGPNCPAWSSTKTYNVGEGVSYGGAAYTSTVYTNLGNTPGTGGNWTLESVTTGQLLVAANVGRAHENGSTVFANGMAGYGIAFGANQGENGLDYPSEVVGSPTNHTLALAYFYAGNSHGQWQWGQMLPDGLGLTSVSVTAGVATITPNAMNQKYEQQPFVTVTYNSNTTLNGRYQQTQNITTGSAYTATLCTTMTGPCVPSTYTGTGTAGYMQIGQTGNGNTSYGARPMAEVLDVNDYRVAGNITSAGTAAYLEENPGSWVVGGQVPEPHLYSQQIAAEDVALSVANPRSTNVEYVREYLGGSGVASSAGNHRAFHFMTSGVTSSTIASGGGIGEAPRGMICTGFNNGRCAQVAEWAEAPFPAGTPMLQVDSLPDMSKYPLYYTPLFQLPGQAGGLSMNWSYNSGHLDIIAPQVYIPNALLPNVTLTNATATTANTSPALTLTNTGTGGATLEVDAANALYSDALHVAANAVGQQAVTAYGVGHGSSFVTKWGTGLNNDGSYLLYDVVGGRTAMSCAPGAACNYASISAGAGVAIGNTNVLPQVGTPTVNKAACIKVAGPPVVIGFCSTVVDATGGCTCN